MRIARIEPGPGQESVWDFPRPPRVEPVRERVTVELAGRVIVDTDRALRVLETSHPPAYYLPVDAFEGAELLEAPGASFCEFKGAARYLSLRVGDRVAEGALWTYPRPSPGYEALAGTVSLYPGRVDRCTVGGEVVQPQEGGFYGGWITSKVVGPFKGARGTLGW